MLLLKGYWNWRSWDSNRFYWGNPPQYTPAIFHGNRRFYSEELPRYTPVQLRDKYFPCAIASIYQQLEAFDPFASLANNRAAAAAAAAADTPHLPPSLSISALLRLNLSCAPPSWGAEFAHARKRRRKRVR
jgi:hypothetical protein